MTRKISSVAILSLLLLAFMGMSAFAAKEAPKRVIDPQVYKSLQYSFPYPNEHPAVVPGADRTVPAQRLGSAAPTTSPGAAIGDTWYDYQQNGSMGRMVETNFGTAAIVHFAWMYMPGPVFASREYQYYSYDITNSINGTVTGLQPSDDYGGYVGITTTGDNRAVVGGHNHHAAGDTLNYPQIYWDFGEANAFFGATARVPLALMQYMPQKTDQEVIWPKFRYVEGPTDTVLHIIAQTSMPDAGDPQAIYYFRRVGGDDNTGATWTFPPYVVDTIYDLSHDIAANNDGKVALVWTANLPCSLADPDTASGTGCRTYGQLDNDVYYQISNDYGVTFQPRVNLTKYIHTEGTDSYRPYTDLSALLDSNGDLHIAWGARAWPAGSQNPGGQAGLYRGRIFHWSENQPFIRTAHSADWDQTVCSPGAWNLNAGKMSVSECNGRLYILFVQINDIPAGVSDDCAVESNPGFPTGSGNGDLYVTISEDGGLTWDKARDVTNSRTPDCDSVGGVGGPCDNDNWPSMARFGNNYALNGVGINATDVVVPTGGSDNGWYLDVQYINDHSAGGIVQTEGTWQDADVRWFRLACVAAITAPNPIITPNEIAFPAWVKPGNTFDTTITIENLGNASYTYAVSKVEQQGNAGWLTTTGFSGFVDFGVSNTGTGTIHANASSYSTGTIALLKGLVILTGNNASSPDTIPVSVVVADTVVAPKADTVATSCLSLAVLNNGEFGNQGPGKVNMDFYNAGDCDTTAIVYLYDGSPVVGWLDGADTVMNWSIFNNSYLTPVGFFPQSVGASGIVGVNEVYSSMFSTRDTSLMFEKTYYAPQDADTCHFIIQRLRVWSGDGAAHSGLTVGEAIDWDIPSDSAARNGSGFNETAGLIYQYGGEYHQDDTGANAACMDNDARYGGVKFLGMYNKAAAWTSIGGNFAGAYTADNATYVFGNDNGFKPSQLFGQMQNTGFSAYSSTNPDSLYADLHMVLTYKTGYTINPGETLVVYVALVTEQGDGLKSLAGFTTKADKAKAWYCAHVLPNPPSCSCCILRGNVDHLGGINVSDLTYLVARLFTGGPPPPCPEEGNVDGLGGTNVSDLTYLVARLFTGGPPPPPCN